MRSVLLTMLLLSQLSSSAQKTFSEGIITFDVINTVDGKLVDSLASYVQLVKGVHYRSDLLSSMGKISTLFDMREGVGAIIREFGSQKTITKLNRNNWREIHKKFQDLNYNITADTINLLGYTCNKATGILNDGSSLEVFFSRSIVTDNAEMLTQFGKLPGLILGFRSSVDGSTISYMAKSLSFDPVQIQKFDVPTTGYRVIGYEESKRK